MEQILMLSIEFEKRNNLNIVLQFCTDGSGHIEEYWDGEHLYQFKNIDDLKKYLSITSYKLNDDGKSLSPIEILTP